MFTSEWIHYSTVYQETKVLESATNSRTIFLIPECVLSSQSVLFWRRQLRRMLHAADHVVFHKWENHLTNVHNAGDSHHFSGQGQHPGEK